MSMTLSFGGGGGGGVYMTFPFGGEGQRCI